MNFFVHKAPFENKYDRPHTSNNVPKKVCNNSIQNFLLPNLINFLQHILNILL